LEDAIINIILSSIVGAASGIYYATILNPLNNYLVFVALFALIGIGVANLVLLVLSEIFSWIKHYFAENEIRHSAKNYLAVFSPESVLDS